MNSVSPPSNQTGGNQRMGVASQPAPDCTTRNNAPPNAIIGELVRYCDTVALPGPRFDIVDQTWPYVTLSCTVSQYWEFGRAKTRRKAKRHAASNMLEMLKNIANNTQCAEEPEA